jgi:hypothetical protein
VTDRKICRKCGSDLPHSDEFFYRSSKGALMARCKFCVREYNNERCRRTGYWKQYHAKNKDDRNAANAARRMLDPEGERARSSRREMAKKRRFKRLLNYLERKRAGKERAYRLGYYTRNSAKMAANAREWRRANPEKTVEIRAKHYRKIAHRPEFILNNRMRVRAHFCLRKNYAFGPRLEACLGYTMDDLRRHIERQFRPGMSWENARKWHIDHIVPVVSFNFSSRTDPEFKACWALSNLRPVWAKTNQRKNAKRIFLI